MQDGRANTNTAHRAWVPIYVQIGLKLADNGHLALQSAAKQYTMALNLPRARPYQPRILQRPLHGCLTHVINYMGDEIDTCIVG